jgi:uncharacterized protein YjbI with pentapeptide repeats
MIRADFSGADLTHASFIGADLAGSTFERARLDGADLSGAELKGVRGLTQSALGRACGDGATKLPKGLHVSACR